MHKMPKENKERKVWQNYRPEKERRFLRYAFGGGGSWFLVSDALENPCYLTLFPFLVQTCTFHTCDACIPGIQAPVTGRLCSMRSPSTHSRLVELVGGQRSLAVGNERRKRDTEARDALQFSTGTCYYAMVGVALFTGASSVEGCIANKVV